MLDLVKLAQKGDKSAFEKLLIELKPVITSQINKYYIVGTDKDDLYQEATVAIYTALNTYDENKSDNFNAFASLCISRRFSVLLKKSQRQKNLALNTSLSLDNTYNKRSDSGDDSEISFIDNLEDEENDIDQMIKQSEVEDKLNNLQKKLSKNENKVLKYYLKGMSYADIAEKISNDEKSVDNTIQRIKRKAKEI